LRNQGQRKRRPSGKN